MSNIEILEDITITSFNCSNIYLNLEEVNKALENLIQEYKEWKKYATEEIEEEITELNNKNCELEFKIEHLIQENKELKKEYERVRNGRNWLIERISAQIATPELFDKLVEENYIQKSKVKELYEHYKNTGYNELEEVLQELLEEGGK